MKNTKYQDAYDFVCNIPLEETMVFEEVYAGDLKLSLIDKMELKKQGAEFIYLREIESGKVIGEIYYISLDQLQEDLGLSKRGAELAIFR